jgi:EAL domain-containing protein (putative c-di-GMP-specific phosphodiesterase class I)/CheY-like chemotaxis protein
MQARDFRLKGLDRQPLLQSQLPERLARLCRRGERLRESWDINALTLLVEDATRLAGLCRELGAQRLAGRLDALHTNTAPLLEPPRRPDRATEALIAEALAAVAGERHGEDASLARGTQEITLAGPTRECGFPLLVVPPRDYVQRLRASFAPAAANEAPETMPVLDASALASPMQPANEPPLERTGEPYRVLIVEDDRSQLLFADSILRHAGMQTCTAADAVEALDALDSFEPELILLDLHMPDCDGLDLTALIRQRAAFAATPIVFLSGDHDARKHAEALRGGGDAFMTKPVRPQQLIEALGEHVEQARRRRRAAEAKAAAPRGLRSCEHLLRTLSDCLAMDDAATRNGGLLLFSPAKGTSLQARAGSARSAQLFGELAARLAAHAGADDLVAVDPAGRLLLFNPDREANLLEAYALNLRDRIAHERVNDADGTHEPIGFDVGICPFIAGARRADSMRHAAQDAIDRGRAVGRSGVFSVRDAAALIDPELLDRIRAALDGNGFSLLFQPIVALRGEEREQFQALLRLRGADGHVYAAAEIVPAAVQSGLIDAIDRWVLAYCINLIAAQKQEGRAPRLFVNQSLESVQDRSLPAWLGGLLRERGVAGDAISLELRAADAAAALPAVERHAESLRAFGVGLTLSGFESGTAGELLLALPADFVKISPRYLRSSAEGAAEELRALVERVHDAGKRVIAPHVEDARGVATLWTAGIDFVQGNFVQHADHELAFDFHASVT